MTDKKYGILSVMMINGKFTRHWVSIPSGHVVFDTPEEAETLAASLEVAAREESILNLGYRARVYDLNEYKTGVES
jgi:hypothetical protein